MGHLDWQPAGTSDVGREITGTPPAGTLFIATCSGISYALTEGDWLLFGRDDTVCSMPVWECIRSEELSRVTGVLWCLDGELWVRNLSTTHELVVGGGAGPQQLPPRKSTNRGAACSVDPRGGWICAPSTGVWRIEMTGRRDAASERPADELATVTLDRPPAPLLPTAVAMCAPLLRQGSRPSTYQEIARLTDSKPRTARDRVDRLLQHYEAMGADRILSRLERGESHYGPLARLLVYRSLVTHDDLSLLVVDPW